MLVVEFDWAFRARLRVGYRWETVRSVRLWPLRGCFTALRGITRGRAPFVMPRVGRSLRDKLPGSTPPALRVPGTRPAHAFGTRLAHAFDASAIGYGT